jgi:hypothetical protein
LQFEQYKSRLSRKQIVKREKEKERKRGEEKREKTCLKIFCHVKRVRERERKKESDRKI